MFRYMSLLAYTCTCRYRSWLYLYYKPSANRNNHHLNVTRILYISALFLVDHASVPTVQAGRVETGAREPARLNHTHHLQGGGFQRNERSICKYTLIHCTPRHTLQFVWTPILHLLVNKVFSPLTRHIIHLSCMEA